VLVVKQLCEGTNDCFNVREKLRKSGYGSRRGLQAASDGGEQSPLLRRFILALTRSLVPDADPVTNRRPPLPDGKTMLSNVEKVVNEYKHTDVMNKKLLDTHETQKKHILNCLSTPANVRYDINDRFKRQVLVRGTNKIENLWRHLRRITPETAGMQLMECLAKIMFTNWNMDR